MYLATLEALTTLNLLEGTAEVGSIGVLGFRADIGEDADDERLGTGDGVAIACVLEVIRRTGVAGGGLEGAGRLDFAETEDREVF